MNLVLTIPLEPPSGNHYKKPSRRGKFLIFYYTPEAVAWYAAVAEFARGLTVDGKAHEVTYTVYQGTGSRGDVDNYAKVILDGLVKAGVLKSDASVVAMHAYKFRDRSNPRTEIIVREYGV